VDFDRQAIERRDFPIGRRGYDPEAVDAHLRALATEVEQLRRGTAGSGDSLGSTAGSQVQSILEAAESAAGEIERAAQDNARQMRQTADRDAEKTREEAVEKAQAHVAAVAKATNALLERVGSMDGEVTGLIETMQSGARRLVADLASVESDMSELYGAAAVGEPRTKPPTAAASPRSSSNSEPAREGAQKPPQQPDASKAAKPTPPTEDDEESEQAGEEGSTDVDGARLIALNMALNGESRSDTDRYLAENFQLENRIQLIDEVYAAIES
jgi:DivIVA domain-containing protein